MQTLIRIIKIIRIKESFNIVINIVEFMIQKYYNKAAKYIRLNIKNKI